MTGTARCPNNRVLPSLGVLGQEKHQLPQIRHVSPSAGESFLPLPKLQQGHGSCPPTWEAPPVSPSSALLKPHTLCLPPTTHPQHLSLCSKLIRLSPKMKASPAVCCAVRMRGCEPHHAALSLKRQQKPRCLRCGNITAGTASPPEGDILPRAGRGEKNKPSPLPADFIPSLLPCDAVPVAV